MFDPASIATAVSLSTAAFNNIKKAFAIGRDLEGMSSDLSRWMKASSDIEQAVKSTKNPPFYKKMLSGDSIEEAAMKSLCGNCVAFDISPRMDECMPGPVSDESGRLGYCWMHHFKCHSARSCDTWAMGGPIEDDQKSAQWQNKSPFGDKE